MNTANVITVDFSRARADAPMTERGGATIHRLTPELHPDSIIAIRVSELTRLLHHRYPGGDHSSTDAIDIIRVVLDHFANLRNGAPHITAWLAQHSPQQAPREEIAAEWPRGRYWRAEPLGVHLGLLADEAHACEITTIGSRTSRRKWKQA
jgi:hypothetical protein